MNDKHGKKIAQQQKNDFKPLFEGMHAQEDLASKHPKEKLLLPESNSSTSHDKIDVNFFTLFLNRSIQVEQ